MPRFAANLSLLFTEHPFLDRFERAARAGFEAVEFLFPYAHAPGEIAARLRAHDLRCVLHNMPPGDWEAGERGLACLPGRGDEFRAGVARAIEYALVLGAPQLHCLAGTAPPGADPELLRRTFVANLRHAAAELRRAGLRLLIEPINTQDMPGYFLNRTAQAIALMDEVGADNLFLQYDVYHAQRSEGELAATLQKHLARIGHVQVADNPGRHEPGSGEIHYAFLWRHLARIGYAGHIGCEYRPAKGTEAGLGWLDAARREFAAEIAAGRVLDNLQP
ncbi:2-oxo-tetronate isomerase [Piscinibacter sp.]|uniref:2-oxo-tetronate isomerase n=1 Tax=Piscinibacter sp. TaxID=1903157 RepID=UPI0039E60BCE